VSAPAAAAPPGAASPDGGSIGGEVVAVLAEAQVLAALAGDGPLSQAGITRRVDAGYQALVPAALARLAGQGIAEYAPGRGDGCAGWRLPG